jgi:hypothetical protein
MWGRPCPEAGSRAPLRWVASSNSPEQHPFVVSVHLSKSGCVNCPVTLVRVLETNWRTARIRTRTSACMGSRNDEFASPVTGSLRGPVGQSNCIAVRRRRKTPPGSHTRGSRSCSPREVPPPGFEPGTARSSVECSPSLS